MEYFRDQTSLPYLPCKDHFTTEELARYMSNPPSFAIFKDRQAVCQKNAMFLIDREIHTSEDLKSDDFSLGNNGTQITEVTLKHATYILSRTYFVHAKYKDFKRRIYSLCKSDGTPGRYILLCYRFGEMEPFTSKSVSLQESQHAAIDTEED